MPTLRTLLVGWSFLGLTQVSWIAYGQKVQSTTLATDSANGEVATAEQVVVFIGDSLTQGYGVNAEEAFPERLGVLFAETSSKKWNVKIVNAGISGSVTADADRRVRFYSKLKPAIYFICLGGNDALKATSVDKIKTNLDMAIVEAKKTKARVILAGMRIFSNYGAEYSKSFEAVFQGLAAKHNIAFIPFLLEGVALDRQLMLPDAKHPNARGHTKIAEKIFPIIRTELEKAHKP